ncbi:MAG TPA: AMP-binding protein [Pseudonocardiaceae bacterium]|jgi:acyl-CoA synthetase (AMP-forming)/AMP-acid ligase II|nr:AMP-binding protein [Pseudonocardiaceae bacterium]
MTPNDLYAAVRRRSEQSDAPLCLPSDSPPYEGSWARLCAATEATEAWLRAEGVRPGAVVAVLGEPEFGILAAMFATWRLGATVTVLANPAGAKRSHTGYGDWLRTRLRQVDASVLISSSPEVDLDWPRSATEGPHGGHCRTNPDSPAPRTGVAPAILQLTSGSTGEPKIVAVTADAVFANVAATTRHLGVDQTDSVVSWLPLNHDMGLIGTLLLPALTGLALRLSAPEKFVRSPMTWLTDLSRQRATMTFAPNFAYSLITRYGRIRKPSSELDLSAMRHCLNGSEPINGQDFAAFGEFAAGHGMARTALRPGYGMAEVGLVLTTVLPGQPIRMLTLSANSLRAGARIEREQGGTTVISCGTPLPGYRVGIRSSAGEVLPDGQVGEICVSGPSLFAGYPGKPRAENFWPDGAYRSGDLGFLDDGEVFVCGRLKDVIIVRGENLVPHELEARAARVDGVRAGNVAAIGVRGSDGAEGVVIVAETARRDRHPEVRALINREIVDAFRLRPMDVVLLGSGELPKTTSGKLQRQLCKENYLRGVWSC